MKRLLLIHFIIILSCFSSNAVPKTNPNQFTEKIKFNTDKDNVSNILCGPVTIGRLNDIVINKDLPESKDLSSFILCLISEDKK